MVCNTVYQVSLYSIGFTFIQRINYFSLTPPNIRLYHWHDTQKKISSDKNLCFALLNSFPLKVKKTIVHLLKFGCGTNFDNRTLLLGKVTFTFLRFLHHKMPKLQCCVCIYEERVECCMCIFLIQEVVVKVPFSLTFLVVYTSLLVIF